MTIRQRFAWKLRRRADTRQIAAVRANNLWALGQPLTRSLRRQLRREARRDLTL